MSKNTLFPEIDKALNSVIQSFAPFQQMISQYVNLANQMNYTIPLREIHAQVLKIDKSIFEQAAKAAIDTKAIYESVSRTTDISEFRRQIESITSGLDEVARRITADWAAMDMAGKGIFSANLLRNLHDIIQAGQDEKDAFCAAGWPISPSMPKALRQRVVELHMQGKNQYASQPIMGYYRRSGCTHLKELVHGWQDHPLLGSRVHIFVDALGVHQDGKYTLSVPTLMPQIEGVLNDYVKKHSLAAKFGKIQEVYTAAIGDTGNYGLAEWAIVQTLLHLLQTNTYVYTSFQNELDKSMHRRAINRHTVLHGVTANYNKESHSLKCFLLLDAVSVLAR